MSVKNGRLETRSAPAAIATMIASVNDPSTARRCRRNRRTVCLNSETCSVDTIWTGTALARAAKPDPRVYPRVEDVDEDVGHEDRGPDHQDDAHHQGGIPVPGGAHRELAH